MISYIDRFKKWRNYINKMKEKFSIITTDPSTHMHMKASALVITHV